MVGFVLDPDDPYKLTEDTRALGLVVCRYSASTYFVPHFFTVVIYIINGGGIFIFTHVCWLKNAQKALCDIITDE
jgi:hypothetical protein